METGIFTLWTLVHIFSGVILALLFSLKEIRLIEFAGFLAIVPLIFVNNPAVKIVSLTVIFISILAFVAKHFLEKKKEFSLFLDIILTLFLLILWELIEYLTYPITKFGAESTLNKIFDVIFGFCGFLAAYILIHRKRKMKIRHKKKSQ
ncbi:MAG: hypothetical protein PHH00_00685 [Candidatus Nanoarchaeia archaeon]|nr:hypothetical protein [Candidatus Nanoarchaeia archaeon]